MVDGSSCASALPAEFAAVDDATASALTAAGRADAWDAPTRAAALAWLSRHRGVLAVIEAKVVAAERGAGTWALGGDRSLAGFVGRVSHQGRGAGMAAVDQAATLDALPQVAEAMVDGPVTVRHVAEITRATEASPLLAEQLATPEGQAAAVELARRFDGAAFGKKLRELSAGLDPAARQREHDAQVAKRFLTLTHRADGTELRGFVDSVTGYKVQKMLDAFNPRPAKDDHRPRDERQAAALGAAADRVLSDARTTPGATAPVQALITLSEQTWAALRATRGNANGPAKVGNECCEPAPGSMADVVARLRGVPAVTDETGRVWPASEIARALCDCTLTRVVLDAKGQPLNLGWQDRLFTTAQWLALYAAGQATCAVDGCDMPLRYSELHHMQWWQHDGRTDLANLAPECSFHHHEIHKYDIRVTRRPDGSYEHRYPDGRSYGGTPPDDTDDGPPAVLPLYDVA